MCIIYVYTHFLHPGRPFGGIVEHHLSHRRWQNRSNLWAYPTTLLAFDNSNLLQSLQNFKQNTHPTILLESLGYLRIPTHPKPRQAARCRLVLPRRDDRCRELLQELLGLREALLLQKLQGSLSQLSFMNFLDLPWSFCYFCCLFDEI